MLRFIFFLSRPGHADMQNSETRKIKSTEILHNPLPSYAQADSHSIQALEVFSVHEANEARSIKAASKPQWFSASPTGTHTKQKNQTLPMKKRSKSDNENDSRMAVDTAFSLEFA